MGRRDYKGAQGILGMIDMFVILTGDGLSVYICQNLIGASLVAQWLRICLPMQETRVRALVWEDPTCHGATKPVSHNY